MLSRTPRRLPRLGERWDGSRTHSALGKDARDLRTVPPVPSVPRRQDDDDTMAHPMRICALFTLLFFLSANNMPSSPLGTKEY